MPLTFRSWHCAAASTVYNWAHWNEHYREKNMGSLMNQVFYTDAYDLSIVSLIVAVFAVAIVAWVVWELAQVILRHMIGKEYSVRVPFSVRVG